MHYVVCGGGGEALAGKAGVRKLADGELIVLEGPWPYDSTTLAVADDDAALEALKPALSGTKGAFAVEGIEAPGDGQAFVIAGHKMLDAPAFKPYAEQIPGMLGAFNVRSLARAGKITPLAGSFTPERGVVLEFSTVEAALAFYTSNTYAPLLDLRLRTTDPRFSIMARKGAMNATARDAAEAYLRFRGR